MTEPTPPQDPESGRKQRVKFGPRPTQTMAHEWAEHMLTELAGKNPALFGRLLQGAALGVTPPTPGRPAGGDR